MFFIAKNSRKTYKIAISYYLQDLSQSLSGGSLQDLSQYYYHWNSHVIKRCKKAQFIISNVKNACCFPNRQGSLRRRRRRRAQLMKTATLISHVCSNITLEAMHYIYVKSLWVMLQLSYIGLSRKRIVLCPILCTKYVVIFFVNTFIVIYSQRYVTCKLKTDELW